MLQTFVINLIFVYIRKSAVKKNYFSSQTMVKNLGKNGAKRNKIFRDSIYGVTKPAIRRLARRGGVKRISDLVYDETRAVLKLFLENIMRDTIAIVELAKRKTVMAKDVVYVLKRQGRVLYGFGG